MRFCRPGTRCTGNSTPKSPRAIMMPSASSMMWSRSVIADGFSILAMMAARFSTSLRPSATSSQRCTNESATQSTPKSKANFRSALSLSVSAPSGSSVSGRLIPLRLASMPPTSTSALISPLVLLVTRMRSLPSSINSTWPASTPSKIC